MPRPATDQREYLISSARCMFAKRGFDGASLRQICRDAGANLAMVRYYFGSKENLYHVVVAGAVKDLLARHPLPAVSSGASGEEALGAFVRWVVGMTVVTGTDRELTRLAVRELMEPTRAMGPMVRSSSEPVRMWGREVVGRVMPAGASAEARARGLAMVVGLCTQHERSGELLEWLGARAPATEAEVEAHAAAVTTFALAGLRALGERGA